MRKRVLLIGVLIGAFIFSNNVISIRDLKKEDVSPRENIETQNAMGCKEEETLMTQLIEEDRELKDKRQEEKIERKNKEGIIEAAKEKEEAKEKEKKSVKEAKPEYTIHKDKEKVNGKVWVTTDLNIRETPINGKVIATIPRATRIDLVEKWDNGWYKINYKNSTGYVSGRYLSKKEIKPKQVPLVNNQKSTKSDNSSKYSAQRIYILGKSIVYKNGGMDRGQAIIDRNVNVASTWGGAGTYSGSDGANTHFIGHRHGAFNGIWNVGIGSTITVTDGNAIPTHYKVVEKYNCDEWGIRTDNGVDCYNKITGSGGESIHLQTCKPGAKGVNWIIRAIKN